MNGLGIPVYELGGIGSDVPVNYREDLGCAQNSKPTHTMQIYGLEFEGLDESIMGLGDCGDYQKLKAYHDQFMLRMRAHVRNTYNLVSTMAAKGLMQQPTATAYLSALKNVDANWDDDNMRDEALNALANLQNDDAVAAEIAKAIAISEGYKNAKLVKTPTAISQSYKKRRGVTVISGLGVYEAEITPNASQEDANEVAMQGLGSVISMAGLGYASDYTVAWDGIASTVGGLGIYEENGDTEEYLLTGEKDGFGKVTVKIKPKNVGTAIKKAVTSVKKATVQKVTPKIDPKVKQNVKNVAKVAGKVVANDAKRALETAKKVGKAVVKTTLKAGTTAFRAGALLAIKINLRHIASRIKWGYATPEQAAKAGLSKADHEKSKSALAKIENLFVKKLQGNKNTLRKAVLSTKAGKLNGFGSLGDPVTLSMILAALPVIVEILNILKGTKYVDPKGKVTEDNADFDPNKPIEDQTGADSDTKVNVTSDSSKDNNVVVDNKPPTPSPSPSPSPSPDSGGGNNAPSNRDVDAGSNNKYTDSNNYTVDDNPVADAKDDPQPNDPATPSDSKSGSGGSGILLGGLAIAFVGITVAKSGNSKNAKKGMDGLDDNFTID